MKKTLTLKDRIYLSGGLLPQKGKYLDLLHRASVVKKTQVTTKEIEEFKIDNPRYTEGPRKGQVVDGGENSLVWPGLDPEKDAFEIEFSKLEEKYIKSILTKLSEDGELTVDHLNLAEMFGIDE